MTMPLEHCPLPWTAEERDDLDGWYDIRHAGDGSLDCCLSKEDAEFIVRACNAHEALLEACDNLCATLETLLAHYGPHMPIADLNAREKLLSDSRAAIAKATEGD